MQEKGFSNVCVCVCSFFPVPPSMAGVALGAPPLSAADQGSHRTKGVYEAIEDEPITGDNTKNGVETRRGDQPTQSAPKYQWSSARIGEEVESKGRGGLAQEIHQWLMDGEVEIPKGFEQCSGQRAAGSGQRAAGCRLRAAGCGLRAEGSEGRGAWRERAWR